ncbi:CesT family type III secretion system chaperone [Pseudomonas syringae pv. tagetis]|uniref:CesT family type III secretion system chaperone n=1 Tax=Pseudomonas syringae pv. tagetis TaxID=129140 RepID=A0ABW7NGB1_9PSED|nr:CesT family type III secretion system chaperone [Pseudomonas syringae group genomosp. 7]UNB67876.1 CesT family type III secretion system chaperone [Pseudomonas syringae pv. tagetis]
MAAEDYETRRLFLTTQCCDFYADALVKNAFDLLIDRLAKDYKMPELPVKQHEHEVYCFDFKEVSIKIYQDAFKWVYFLSDIGVVDTLDSHTCQRLLRLNEFNLSTPFFTVGLTEKNGGVVHTRIPFPHLDNVEMRRVVEALLNVSGEVKKPLGLSDSPV